MAATFCFDVMSDVDCQEQVNAVDQLNANWMASVYHYAVPAPFREPPRNT